jgi:hypothetical protein
MFDVDYMKKIHLTIKLILLIAILLIFVLPFSKLYPYDPTLTYVWHIDMAKKMAVEGSILTPHFLYQALVILLHTIAPFITFEVAGYYIVPLATCCILGLIIYDYIFDEVGNLAQPLYFYMIPIITIALLMITPLSLPTYPRLYLGYIGITMYHSATTMLAKPSSLLLFIYIVKLFKKPYYRAKQRQLTLCLIVLTTLSILAKPSYLICLIPATILIILYKIFTKKGINWHPLILGFILPSILILGWQFIFSYLNKDTVIIGGESSIIFAPFVAMGYYSKNLLGEFLLSIAFPLCVYLCYFTKARRDNQLNFAWLIFFIGAFYTYFLAESGNRIYAGNFFWSGQLTLFILFVVSTTFVLKQPEFVKVLKTNVEDTNIFSCLYQNQPIGLGLNGKDILNEINFFLKHLFCAFIFVLHWYTGILFLINTTHTGGFW